MEIGCQFATSIETAAHIRAAERLGYRYAFTYDSPTIYADPWIALARAVDHTSRIQLGIAVITPRLRHLTASAAALATLATLAPHRPVIVVGAGFTSQLMLGQKPAPWAEVAGYVHGLRSLLAGQTLDWEGATIGLFHAAASGVRLPAEVPVWVAANGPRGLQVAAEVGDLVLTSARPAKPVSGRWGVTFHGLVLEDGEDFSSPSVLAAAGPAAAFMLHRGETGPAAGTAEARGFSERIAQVPAERRHIETHRSHLIEVTPLERPFVTPQLIRRVTVTGSAAEVRAAIDRVAAAGADVLLYQPAGPDIPRRLASFARAAGM